MLEKLTAALLLLCLLVTFVPLSGAMALAAEIEETTTAAEEPPAVVTEPTPTPTPTPEPTDETSEPEDGTQPCALTPGCTLGAGHEGASLTEQHTKQARLSCTRWAISLRRQRLPKRRCLHSASARKAA